MNRSHRPKSSPAKVRAASSEARDAEAAVFLPSLDNINVPTISLLTPADMNKRPNKAGAGAKRRASSADGHKAKARPIGSTTEEISHLKEQVQFERQFMSTKLRSGSAGRDSEPAETTGSGIARKGQAMDREGKLTAMQRQNARLKSKSDRLEANQQLFESTQEHIDAAVSGERLRRKNLEGNVKAWEKERRDMLREARERRRQIEALETRLEQSNSDLAQQEDQGEQLEGELSVALRTIAELQEADGRRRMEQQALIKALALAKQQGAEAVQERDANQTEMVSLREEVSQLQSDQASSAAEAESTRERLERELSTAQSTMNETLSELLEVRQARKTAVEFGCQAGTSFVNMSAYTTPRPTATPKRKLAAAPSFDSPESESGDGSVDTEQWRAIFEVFDSNGKGQIDAEKIRRVFTDFGEVLSEEQLRSMLSAGGAGGRTVTLSQFASLMSLQFQPELWRMARAIAEQRLAVVGQSGSKLLDLNFIARARKTQGDADSEDDERGKSSPSADAAAKRIQAVRRGLITRQQTKQLKQAVSKMVLQGASPDTAKLVSGAFTQWAEVVRKAVTRRNRKAEQHAQHVAAVRIQTVYRGHSTRKLFGWTPPSAVDEAQVESRQQADAVVTRSGSGGGSSRGAKRDHKQRRQQEQQEQQEQEEAATKIQARVRGRKARKEQQSKRRRKNQTRRCNGSSRSLQSVSSAGSITEKAAQTELEEAAARKIQSRQRGRIARRRVANAKQQPSKGRFKDATSSSSSSSSSSGSKAKAPAKTKTMDPATSAGFWQKGNAGAVTAPKPRPSSGKRRKEPPQPKTLGASSPTATTFRTTSSTSDSAAAVSPLTQAVQSVVRPDTMQRRNESDQGSGSDAEEEEEEEEALPSPTPMPSFASLDIDIKATRRPPAALHKPAIYDGGRTPAERPPPSRESVRGDERGGGGGALWDVAAASRVGSAGSHNESASEDEQDDEQQERQMRAVHDDQGEGEGKGGDEDGDEEWVKPRTAEEEEELLDSFEVVCPACTLVCDICAVKCAGCGGSLADAELAEM